MASHIEDVWKEATGEIPRDVADYWWTKILKQYGDGERICHDVNYLQDTFDRYETVKSALENPNAVALALFFHYFEYDPKAVDGTEKNIEHFNTFATEAGIPNESSLRTQVVELLQAASTHSTEEHKTDGAFGSEDRHYFLDIDIADLGLPPEQYAEYSAKVQKEYEFLPLSMYKSLRVKVLETFLQIPNIFATKEFREKYETRARTNIQDEIKSLKS